MKSAFLLPLLFVFWAVPAVSCEPRTEMEKVYCRLKSDGVRLPALEDFRKNPAKIQRLLLKRPAAAAGIRLPGAGSGRESAVVAKGASSDKNTLLRASSPASVTPASEIRSATSATPRPSVSSSSSVAQDCRLNGARIDCGGDQFRLVLNRKNRELTPGSLSPDNRMALPAYQQGGPSEAQHLAESYEQYIEKMLQIGLGGVTMSYTKFVYTRQEMLRQGQDIQARFETMYSYLKRDKQQMAIKPSYDDSLPPGMDSCSRLNSRLWVCDVGNRNWVYEKQ
ncbi:hypothetical protein HBA55_05975 [Pseudomaricurvus alkylphenolicus]|uniref:hypothetical protein n=1 Tax=Pseudomaricurvus alkylphenolicus TaxID=1306991 RepID=UPI0014227ED5|nr:hypothetical protein [Pseudomaricurvus alkylphenolicus]NIB39123.1 hypothetical protein [Pseudomaricurvus alkylphenolicus]